MGYSGFSWDLCGLPFFSFFFLFKVLTAAFLVKERRRNFPVPYRVDCSYLYLFLLCVYIFICVTVGKAGGNCCGWDTARRNSLFIYIFFLFCYEVVRWERLENPGEQHSNLEQNDPTLRHCLPTRYAEARLLFCCVEKGFRQCCFDVF